MKKLSVDLEKFNEMDEELYEMCSLIWCFERYLCQFDCINDLDRNDISSIYVMCKMIRERIFGFRDDFNYSLK